MTEKLSYWPFKTYNWGRWDNDQGTLNFIDDQAVKRALSAPLTNTVVTLGSPLRQDEARGGGGFSHRMLHARKYDFGPKEEPVFEAADEFSVVIHGLTNAHIDALAHVGHKGKSFNDTQFEEIVTEKDGAVRMSVDRMGGIVTRAWFVDVPRQRGLQFLTPGDPVIPEDIAGLEGLIEPGDALLIRTGRFSAPLVRPDDDEARDDHGNWSGLHFECVDLIDRWSVSTVGTDGPGDNFPSTCPDCSVPIHILFEAYMGLPLIHSLNLEALSEELDGRVSKAVMLAVAPLILPGGTGSPVNPLAII
ncbi:MAG: cyclase family protein [Gammaproteobacteria bacterium]|nr:cyclase family protein [Gammaproteobacteria bacterium]